MRRQLELSLVQPSGYPEQTHQFLLTTIEKFHAALNELSDHLAPPYLDDSLPLAIRSAMETWKVHHPQYQVRLQLPAEWICNAPDQEIYKVEFALYEPGARGYRLLYKKQLEGAKGIRKFTLPDDVSGLINGQTDLWQVALLCDPSDPSKNTLTKATIDVVAIPTGLKAALAQTPDRLKRADILQWIKVLTLYRCFFG